MEYRDRNGKEIKAGMILVNDQGEEWEVCVTTGRVSKPKWIATLILPPTLPFGQVHMSRLAAQILGVTPGDKPFA